MAGSVTDCITDNIQKQFIFTWAISNFSMCLGPIPTRIVSSEFGDDENIFYLTLNSNSKNHELCLSMTKCGIVPRYAVMEFRVMTASGYNSTVIKSHTEVLSPNSRNNAIRIPGWLSSVTADKTYCPNNIFTFQTKLTVCGVNKARNTNSTLASIVGKRISHNYKLSVPDEYKTYLDTGDFHDVEVQCGARVFKCHRIILGARSKFFETMFKSEMYQDSKNNGKVDLSDVDPEVLEVVIAYMYTGECALLEERALEIFICCDRLLIDCLKGACYAMLPYTFTVENVCDRIVAAKIMKLDDLFKLGMQFFIEKKKEIIATENWKQLKVDNLQLVIEILESS